MGQNHESTRWKHFVQATACTPHYICFHGTLEPGTGSESWLVVHHLLAGAFILQESHSPFLLTYTNHICVRHIQATYTEDQPHSSQLLLRKTK